MKTICSLIALVLLSFVGNMAFASEVVTETTPTFDTGPPTEQTLYPVFVAEELELAMPKGATMFLTREDVSLTYLQTSDAPALQVKKRHVATHRALINHIEVEIVQLE